MATLTVYIFRRNNPHDQAKVCIFSDVVNCYKILLSLIAVMKTFSRPRTDVPAEPPSLGPWANVCIISDVVKCYKVLLSLIAVGKDIRPH